MHGETIKKNPKQSFGFERAWIFVFDARGSEEAV